MRNRRGPVAILLVLCLLALPGRRVAADSFVLGWFEVYLEALRRQAGIPGLSATIVIGEQIAWEGGFGFSDIENSVRATPDTPYYIADLTQTFTSVLVLRCVEEGLVALSDPIRRVAPAIPASVLPEPGVEVRHLLTHTSRDVPGTIFEYDPGRYALLGAVVDVCADRPYPEALARGILERLALVDSVPGRDFQQLSEAAPEYFDEPALARYGGVLERLARPYRLDRRGRPVPSDLPPAGLNASFGLISTVRDMARFDLALDEDDDLLLRPETLALAWANGLSADGGLLPHGLGWFVQTHRDERLVWHFGLAENAFSSLILKVPGRQLTLILLANSDGLSTPFILADGDVTVSPFARLFLRLFII